MRIAFAAVIALVWATATAALADPPGQFPGGYKYKTTLNSATPFTGMFIVEILAEYTAYYKDDNTTAYWGGTEYYEYFFADKPTTNMEFFFQLQSPYAIASYFGGREVIEAHPFTANVLFSRSSGVSPITLTTVAIGAVPEPATWGLMILGFGLAGSALRRGARAYASV